ncbi:hypothetical protein FIBSPDRAFT_202764 [Athelia psychrophila]|uniref:Uncharacterized protein n=1 Tax=Athelia psychrophila TaxID=1759441 RepID=A0A165ZHI2_9AGAM|nr:hypothetical protein FIBSPDRAFT_202764 [Fibularhizoctonia sp. CBS 109695]
MRIWELMSATLGFLYHPNIRFASRDGTRRTEATLNAHLRSHSDAITGLAVSPDHMSFVFSSDDDKTCGWSGMSPVSRGTPVKVYTALRARQTMGVSDEITLHWSSQRRGYPTIPGFPSSRAEILQFLKMLLWCSWTMPIRL